MLAGLRDPVYAASSEPERRPALAPQVSSPSFEMEHSIYRYILKHSLRDQINLLLLTAFSMPFVYVSLEIPKLIINRAIGGEDIPPDVLGYPIDQIGYLLLLCSLFLLLVIFNGALKYYTNIYVGIVGERMIRRLRYELYCRVLRFPLPHFKRTSAGEMIPMITAETEALGGFVGEAYSLPAQQGGLLVTYLIFIFNQDVLLGAAALALYPFQLWLIPRLQRRINELSKQRVLTVRRLSDRIGESVGGIQEIHANGTTRFERADIADRLGTILAIRYEIYRRKFFIKFLNNFLAQVTPFFFYLVGGLFVIRGDLTIGALVAVLAAYKDLAGPWAELLKYYQTKEDIRVKYSQIIEQFAPANMLDEKLIDLEPERVEPLQGTLEAVNLSFAEDQLVMLLDSANFRFQLDQHVAIVGAHGSGREELSRLVARLLLPSAGRLRLGEVDLAELPEAVTGRRLAYAGGSAYLFAGTVRDNLHYGLKQRPVQPPAYDEKALKQRHKVEKQAKEAGNSTDDLAAQWIDLEPLGLQTVAELDDRAIELFQLVELEDDIYQLGLRSTIDPGRASALAQHILEARSALRGRLQAEGLTELVEPFDSCRYNNNATVAENLVFGIPRGEDLDAERLAQHPYVRRILSELGLLEPLTEVGRKVAATMVELFADLPPGHEFFERFSFISAEDLPEFQAMLARISSRGMAKLSEEDRARLLSLCFLLIPARHRLGVLDEQLQARLLEARRAFSASLPEELRPRIEFFDPEQYNAAATLQDNILFGKRVFGHAHGQRRVGELMQNLVCQLGLRQSVLKVGLDYHVGNAGARLSSILRQKIVLIRCLLKHPDLLVVNDATAGLDEASEARILDRLREHMGGRGLLWTVSRPTLAARFDRVLVVEDGRVLEQGSYAELSARPDSAMMRMLGAN